MCSLQQWASWLCRQTGTARNKDGTMTIVSILAWKSRAGECGWRAHLVTMLWVVSRTRTGRKKHQMSRRLTFNRKCGEDDKAPGSGLTTCPGRHTAAYRSRGHASYGWNSPELVTSSLAPCRNSICPRLCPSPSSSGIRCSGSPVPRGASLPWSM